MNLTETDIDNCIELIEQNKELLNERWHSLLIWHLINNFNWKLEYILNKEKPKHIKTAILLWYNKKINDIEQSQNLYIFLNKYFLILSNLNQLSDFLGKTYDINEEPPLEAMWDWQYSVLIKAILEIKQ